MRNLLPTPLRATIFAATAAFAPAVAGATDLVTMDDVTADADTTFTPIELQSDPDAKPFVVGGEQAPKGRWPDAAGIIFYGSYVGCTGTLISPHVVLTAGHCAGGITGVILNSTDYLEYDSPEVEVIDVVDTITHPRADISVLLLASKAKTPYRTVAQDCVLEEHLRKNAPVWVVGYGATRSDGGGNTTELNHGRTKVQTPDCNTEYVNDIYTGCDFRLDKGSEIGAGGNGVDACFGDSGGPLYLEAEAESGKDFYLVGVTSRAYSGVPQNAPCAYGGIYVRPDAFVDWIEEVSGRKVPYPDCNEAPEVEAPAILVGPSGQGLTQIEVLADADSTNHTFEIAEQPKGGTATVDADGIVTFTADADFDGETTLTVLVKDNGDVDWPNAPKQKVNLDIEVIASACGCTTGGGLGMSAWVLLLAGLGFRRRR